MNPLFIVFENKIHYKYGLTPNIKIFLNDPLIFKYHRGFLKKLFLLRNKINKIRSLEYSTTTMHDELKRKD